MTEKTPPLFDNDVNQKYQLLAKIGSGGMGNIYLGIQRGAVDFNRLVVIKCIHAHLFQQDEKFKEEHARMFLHEASLVASLNHPHIVKIFDFCIAGPSMSIVMEYVEGETLRYVHSKCAKYNEPIPVPLICRLILDACDALHYAHGSTSPTGEVRQVIHRDIGLHNLMLDSNGYLKVIDFGIAKSNVQSEMTSPGLIKGNPGYMAPDLFKEQVLDHRIDIYALGLCLYELLTLKRAFKFEGNVPFTQIIQEVFHRELPPPSDIVPDLPEGIDDIVSKATKKDRKERYQDIEKFADDLRSVAAGLKSSESDSKRWFSNHFDKRLRKRREFSARMLELARNTGVLASQPPSNPSPPPSEMVNLNSLTPTPTDAGGLATTTPGFLNPSPQTGSHGNNPATSAQPPMQASKFSNVHVLIGLVFTFFLGCAFVLYLFFFQTPSTTKASSAVDNLTVNCEPSGATLSIDGGELGLVGWGGLSFHVEPNEKHTIVLSKEGYRDYTLPFIGPSKGTKQINALLIEIKKMAQDTKRETIQDPPANEAIELDFTGEDNVALSRTDNWEREKGGPTTATLKMKKSRRRLGKKAASTHADSKSGTAGDQDHSNVQSSPKVGLLEDKKPNVPLLDSRKKPVVPMLDDRKETPAQRVPLI